jgi:thiamine biosynthesis protein ThiI
MVAALLSGGIDSPVAAWRLMKRGCRVTFVHFHSVPYLPDISRGKARALVERLTAWQYVSRLFLVPFGEIQRAVVLAVPGPLRVVVYRRLMLRIAEVLARSNGALALVTGESVGQVASQTLHNLARVDEVADLPVLRPLIGMDKLEITAQAEAIDTFGISIEPDADCCTLFVPKNPGTRASREEIDAVESRLDVAGLVEMGVTGAELETFDFPVGAGPMRPPSAAARGGAGRR